MGFIISKVQRRSKLNSKIKTESSASPLTSPPTILWVTLALQKSWINPKLILHRPSCLVARATSLSSKTSSSSRSRSLSLEARRKCRTIWKTTIRLRKANRAVSISRSRKSGENVHLLRPLWRLPTSSIWNTAQRFSLWVHPRKKFLRGDISQWAAVRCRRWSRSEVHPKNSYLAEEHPIKQWSTMPSSSASQST